MDRTQAHDRLNHLQFGRLGVNGVHDIPAAIAALKSELGDSCTLVAVSKTKPLSDLLTAYDAGQRDFGENKVQEIIQKAPQMPGDVRWHFIGHLQRNKVKSILPLIHLIHSVDSTKLLAEIDNRAGRAGRIIDCLLQVHIAAEETKFGFDQTEINTLLRSEWLRSLSHIRIKGLMGMATNTRDADRVRSEFSGLHRLYDSCRDIAPEPAAFHVLSMGMTSDYKLAVTEGSNMVRLGSLIFGERA